MIVYLLLFVIVVDSVEFKISKESNQTVSVPITTSTWNIKLVIELLENEMDGCGQDPGDSQEESGVVTFMINNKTWSMNVPNETWKSIDICNQSTPLAIVTISTLITELNFKITAYDTNKPCYTIHQYDKLIMVILIYILGFLLAIFLCYYKKYRYSTPIKKT